MSILRTHNLQNPDSSSINIVMDKGGNTNITGVTTVGSNFHVTDGISRIGALTEYGTKTVSSKGLIISSSGEHTLKLIDTTSYATNVGASILLGGQYRASGDAQEFVKLKSFKENSTNGNYAYGFSISTNANNDVVTERLRITSTGLVGIGTDNPGTKLDVRGGNWSNGDIVVGQSGNAGRVKFRRGVDGSDSAFIGFAAADNNSRLSIGVDSGDGTIAFQTNSAERLRITSTGLVGIGTDIPTAPLTVMSSSDPEIKFGYKESQSHTITWDSSKIFLNADPGNANGSSAMGFRVDGTERLRITSTGLVGIGTDIPNEELHIHASGTSYIRFTDEASGTGSSDGAIFGLDHPHLYAWNYEAGDFVVATNATEKFRVTSDGKISQGGHAPSYEYDLRGTGLQSILVGSENASGAMLILDGDSNGDGSGTDYASILHSSDGNIEINNRKSAGIIFKTTSSETERLRITSSGIIKCGTSSVLKAEINNAVSGHQFISQCSDNNNGFEVYQQHGSNTTRNNFAVYANTGNSNAKNLQFAVRGDGVVSSPQQPAFSAIGFPSHRYMNTWHNVDLDDWNYLEQNGSHFNNSNGRFTAPVAGKYFFIYTSMYHNPSSNDFHNYIIKNGSTITQSNNISGGGSSEGHQWNDCTVQAVVTMAANDYVTARSTGSSSSTCYLYGSGVTSKYSSFCGFLIG